MFGTHDSREKGAGMRDQGPVSRDLKGNVEIKTCYIVGHVQFLAHKPVNFASFINSNS